jgi:hypothetical protein
VEILSHQRDPLGDFAKPVDSILQNEKEKSSLFAPHDLALDHERNLRFD